LVSTLLSKCRAALIMHEGHGLLDKDSPDEALFKEILFLEQKLQLMLNPNEQNHQELINLVGAITDDVQHGASNIIEFGQRINDAAACCKGILKREWERVKYGESLVQHPGRSYRLSALHAFALRRRYPVAGLLLPGLSTALHTLLAFLLSTGHNLQHNSRRRSQCPAQQPNLRLRKYLLSAPVNLRPQ